MVLKLAPLGLSMAFSASAPQTVELGSYPDGRRPAQTGVSTQSQYLKMDDGVRLAVDVLLPQDSSGKKYPTILRWARNGRAARNAPPAAFDVFFVEHGYARVLVDERGTGASFGQEKFGKRNLKDMNEILNWITRQPWSNGKIGAEGDFADGGSQNGLLHRKSGNPGCGFTVWRLRRTQWHGDAGRRFRRMVGQCEKRSASKAQRREVLQPVDEDRNDSLLKQALRDHQSNPDVAGLLEKIYVPR
jgi:putative CocE/NonD family hydrolase